MNNYNLFNNQSDINFDTKINEDVVLYGSLNEILKLKRGYVIKMPERGSSVVACMSGGLDSIANMVVLMAEFGYKVYPFFINRGQSTLKQEKASVDYFNKIFLHKYPNNYQPCIEICVDTPAKAYKNLLRDTKKAANKTIRKRNISYPSRNSIIFLAGAEYAYSLKSKGEEIKTIFGAFVASDLSYHCSLTWIRSLNIHMCQILGDWSFQFVSIPIELELGNFFDKEVYVHYLNKHNLPIEQTRTCMEKNKKQCGDCAACYHRRLAIQRAGIVDKTEYIHKTPNNYHSYYNYYNSEQKRF